jgi:hypothetical protein
LVTKSLQEFATTTDHLAHHAHTGLPNNLISKEAAHAFTNGIRQQMVRHLLLEENSTLSEALNQELKLEAADIAAERALGSSKQWPGYSGGASTPKRKEGTASMNLIRKTSNVGYKTASTPETTESRREEIMGVAGMQQQPMYIGSEHPGHNVHQGPSTAGWNNPTAASVGASAIVGGTAKRDPPETLHRRKLTD